MDSFQVTTDAPLARVLDILRNHCDIVGEDVREGAHFLGTRNGSQIVVARDLHLTVDEDETWVSTNEVGDPGQQFEIYRHLADELEERVTREPRDDHSADDPGETRPATTAA